MQKSVDWWLADVRENMIQDLIDTDTLIHINKKVINVLLGKPNKIENNSLINLIREKYERNIDSVYISYLHIELDSNEMATKCRIKM